MSLCETRKKSSLSFVNSVRAEKRAFDEFVKALNLYNSNVLIVRRSLIVGCLDDNPLRFYKLTGNRPPRRVVLFMYVYRARKNFNTVTKRRCLICDANVLTKNNGSF